MQLCVHLGDYLCTKCVLCIDQVRNPSERKKPLLPVCCEFRCAYERERDRERVEREESTGKQLAVFSIDKA